MSQVVVINTLAPKKMPNGRIRDLTGERFGRLTVESIGAKKGNEYTWICRCDCGSTKAVKGSKLKSGRTRSCGCLHNEVMAKIGKSQKKHGMTGSPEYRAWSLMKSRCLNPNNPRYAEWGGRGITVCKEWINSFEAFYAAVGPRPAGEKRRWSLGRINNFGNYEPGNVEWQDPKTQARNRRSNVIVVLDGVSLCASEWTEKLGIPPSTLLQALRSGATLDDFRLCPLPEPEFKEGGEANLGNKEIRKRIAETVCMMMELPHPRVYAIRDIANVIDLSGEQTRRILRGISTPTEPVAAKLVDFLRANLNPKVNNPLAA